MNLDANTPLPELETHAAEHLVLACDPCQGVGYARTGDAYGHEIILKDKPCIHCDGTGVRHPLRIYGCTHDHKCDPKTCCFGSYWFNSAPDVATDAIRAKGWILERRSDPFAEFAGEPMVGDYVEIVDPYATPTHGVRIGQTTEDEGLRGRHALLLALCRALEATG